MNELNESEKPVTQKQIRELILESRIQTIFVVIAFFFGVKAISDIYKKLNKN